MSKKNLREGVTTGTCAAAAARASVEWQICGKCPDQVEILTPYGKRIELQIIPHAFPKCGVIKDAGDDPDVTDGCEVVAEVHLKEDVGKISFSAGEGIGIITAPGLKIPVGEAAINPVPREMIEKEIREIAGDVEAHVVISIPGGTEIAKRTFNPRVGIKGGLSILGTTGIVRPMSESAMIESLKVYLSVAAASDAEYLIFVLGESGEKSVRKYLMTCGKDLNKTAFVLVSNYIGIMLDEAKKLGVKKILLAGTGGKLVKVAADIMNTHSHVADGRMETICTFAAMAGADAAVIRKLYASRTVVEANGILRSENLMGIWQAISDKAAEKCQLRTQHCVETAVLLLDEKGCLLGKSKNMEAVSG